MSFLILYSFFFRFLVSLRRIIIYYIVFSGSFTTSWWEPWSGVNSTTFALKIIWNWYNLITGLTIVSFFNYIVVVIMLIIMGFVMLILLFFHKKIMHRMVILWVKITIWFHIILYGLTSCVVLRVSEIENVHSVHGS